MCGSGSVIAFASLYLSSVTHIITITRTNKHIRQLFLKWNGMDWNDDEIL